MSLLHEVKKLQNLNLSRTFPAYKMSSKMLIFAGFIFTTSLPPTVLAGSLASIRLLRSQEGRQLRSRHRENVEYLRASLFAAGVGVEQTPSHIIPVHVGNPVLCSSLSDLLLQRYGHYVQAINYPTVPRGQEKLRIAPTPHHTKVKMHIFAKTRVY